MVADGCIEGGLTRSSLWAGRGAGQASAPGGTGPVYASVAPGPPAPERGSPPLPPIRSGQTCHCTQTRENSKRNRNGVF